MGKCGRLDYSYSNNYKCSLFNKYISRAKKGDIYIKKIFRRSETNKLDYKKYLESNMPIHYPLSNIPDQLMFPKLNFL